MNRRTFLRRAGALSVLSVMRMRPASASRAPDEVETLARIRVTEVVGFRHVCPRPKLVGKNSHLDVHGDTTSEDCLRIRTDQGIEGIGIGRITHEIAREVVGKTLAELYTPGVGSTGPLGRADHALFDLVGKALGKPSWELIGDAGAPKTRIYDGSIYFADLLPEYESRGVARILEEIDDSLERGQRAFKIKIGRGFKWMERDAGFARDVEVVRAIREHVGSGILLMVDANNGYDLETTYRFLDAIETELFFIEEMFPEDVELDRQLKAHIAEHGWATLVADGESARDVDHFAAYIAANAIDVLQADIRAFGITKLWELSRLAAGQPGITLAPHNWGSFLGVHMQTVLARGIPNFLMAEMDTATSDLFDTSAFVFEDGRMTVPDQPGNGLALRENVWKRRYADQAWSVRVPA